MYHSITLTINVVVYINNSSLLWLCLPQAVCDAHQACSRKTSHMHFLAAVLVYLELGCGLDHGIVSVNLEADVPLACHTGQVEVAVWRTQNIGHQRDIQNCACIKRTKAAILSTWTADNYKHDSNDSMLNLALIMLDSLILASLLEKGKSEEESLRLREWIRTHGTHTA